MEHAAEPLWFTVLLNKLLAAPVAAGLAALGIEVEHPAAPIPDHVAMQVLVVFILFVGAFTLRRQLSVTQPGKFQQIMEVVVQFITDMLDEIIGHDGRRYLALIGTLGLFIVVCNLIGIIPSFHSPTANIQVTLGCATAAFLYYNFHGVRQRGVVGYLKHLCGPVLAMAVLMFPIEVVGNLGRMLSLSVRLYANMSVGTLLEEVFGGLIPIFVPAIFMGLHLFVSFLQAYIFMLLPSVYIGIAVAEEH